MRRKEFLNRSAILGASIVIGGPLWGNEYWMMSSEGSREVLQILNPHRTKVGSLPIVRLFPGGKKDYISPFVLFDEFGAVQIEANDEPLGVAAHPHAGIVPTTYFIEGSGHHVDNMNYNFQVNKGEFMMFSSGRGAIHMEETGQKLYDEGGSYHGFQIWLNLPAKNKYINPNTYVHKNEDLPKIKKKGYTVDVIMGEFEGYKSAAYTHSPAFYYRVKVNANQKINFIVDPMHNAFVYNTKGELELKGQQLLKEKHLAIFERNKSQIEVYSQKGGEFLLLGGQPLNDPIVAYGPFVMNSQAQIQQCIRDYQAGKMGNPDLVK